MTKIKNAERLGSTASPKLPPSLPYTSKVALRLPEIIKEAATALSCCVLYEENSDETLNARAPTSMNNMLVELLWKGLSAYLPIVEAEIARRAEELVPYRDIAAFFMKSPSLAGVQPEDMPKGSTARDFLSAIKQENPGARWPISRGEALEDFASHDSWLSQLYSTREILTNVISANPRPRW